MFAYQYFMNIFIGLFGRKHCRRWHVRWRFSLYNSCPYFSRWSCWKKIKVSHLKACIHVVCLFSNFNPLLLSPTLQIYHCMEPYCVWLLGIDIVVKLCVLNVEPCLCTSWFPWSTFKCYSTFQFFKWPVCPFSYLSLVQKVYGRPATGLLLSPFISA